MMLVLPLAALAVAGIVVAVLSDRRIRFNPPATPLPKGATTMDDDLNLIVNWHEVLRAAASQATPDLGPDFDFYTGLPFDWPPKRRRPTIYNWRYER